MVADLFRGKKWDLVKYRRVWFALSLAVILTGLAFMATRGLNYGVDFTGGGLVKYELARPVPSGQEAATLAQAREALLQAGVEGRLQLAGTAVATDQILVRTLIPVEIRDQDAELARQRSMMMEQLGAAFPEIREIESQLVTPVVSRELIERALWAVAWGCVFILLWIRLRYQDFKWSTSAVVALAHDVLVLIGVFAITQREINSPFVAAALTVVGYSVHDTIVIFDRIRENVRLRKGATFAETANISLLETMPRSINTTMTTLFVLIALYTLGGASLRDFTLAMIVGITAGAYSSIFTAAQLLTVMKEREERKVAVKRAAGRAPRAVDRSGAVRRRPLVAAAPVVEKPKAEEGEEDREAAEEVAKEEGQKERLERGERRKLKAGRKRKRRF